MKTRIKILVIFLVILSIAWFVLALGNYYRVGKDQRPILCYNYVKEAVDDDEYSLTCTGILYKYREYYYVRDDSMSAREFALFFMEFTREK